MHSVAGNVLFYNSWERVSDLKITEMNIFSVSFPLRIVSLAKIQETLALFSFSRSVNCLAALGFVNCRITGPLIYVSLNAIMPFVLWIVRSKSFPTRCGSKWPCNLFPGGEGGTPGNSW